MPADSEPPIVRRDLASIVALGAVSILLIVLHVRLLLNSGAFWRDESSSILLAQAPSWRAMWHHLAIDSFPGLFVTLLRTWIQSGLGGSDFGIRLLGILISLGMLVSVFLSCRAMRVRFPLLALCLVGLNSVVFYAGTSLRAYGLAALLIVACFAAFWRVAVQPTRWNAATSLLLAVLSVHCNYQNSYLLFGIGMSAATVAALERKWLRSVLILAMCLAAALSLLIYMPVIANYRGEMIISNYALSFGLIGAKLLRAIAANGPLLLFGWIAGALALISVAFRSAKVAFFRGAGAPAQRVGDTCLARPQSEGDNVPPAPGLYCLLTVTIAAVTGAIFFKINGMFPFPWHFIPFVAVCAVAIECGTTRGSPSSRLVFGKIVLACYVAVVSLPAVWNASHLRRTNIDLVAAELETRAQANDLILLDPFWLRPSFMKYYHGAAPWRIVPIDPDDPAGAWLGNTLSIKAIMVKPDSIQPTLDLVQKTLQGGGKVWIVGYISELPEGAKLPPLLPAPHPEYGWNNNAYAEVWSLHLSDFLRTHAQGPESLDITSSQPVNHFEDVPLAVFHGWRDR